jgi:hypothetical protein
MGQGKGTNRAFNNYKKPNIDHFAHQKNVTGVGAHQNTKKYSRKFNKKKVEEVIEDVMRENTAEEVAAQTPNDDGDFDDGRDE